MIINSILYITSFTAIWFGAGLIVSSVDDFARRLRISSFAVSFIVLGTLTSTPEFGVGLTAIAQEDPEIYVGNLIGGIPVLFFFVIPLLAILGNGISLKRDFDNKTFFLSLLVILVPSMLVLDGHVGAIEAIVMLLSYIGLVAMIQRKHGFLDTDNTNALDIKAYSYKDVLKILLGIAIVFIASNVIVDKTLYFSDFFDINPFYVSFFVLSLGTNLPEISIAIKSVLAGKKDLAFGDYMGSAAANTLLFGIFTLLTQGGADITTNFISIFLLLTAGLVIFYVFASTKEFISRKEGAILFCIFLAFIIVELSK